MEKTENKKFKFNIIDVIFILIIVAGLIFVGYKFIGNKTTSAKDTYIVTFFTEQVANDVTSHLTEGVSVYDDTDNIVMGTLKSSELSDAISYNVNESGQTIVSDKPGYNSVTLQAEVRASDFSNGILIDSVKYSVNHSFVARVGDTKLYLRITDIQKASESKSN